MTGNFSQHPQAIDREYSEHKEVLETLYRPESIKGFFGAYRFLSNFGEAVVYLDGVQYGSVEKAYQAAKWHPEDRYYFQNCTNREAVFFNRNYQPNMYTIDEWDAKKIDTMYELLHQKFDREINFEMHEKLMATGYRYIEETNWWGDRFWGKDMNGEGENVLGTLIMMIRAEMRGEDK